VKCGVPLKNGLKIRSVQGYLVILSDLSFNLLILLAGKYIGISKLLPLLVNDKTKHESCKSSYTVNPALYSYIILATPLMIENRRAVYEVNICYDSCAYNSINSLH
jgi:hypothetical protein